ncbi:MAG: hypothetical protein COX62_07055 [Deltaproteobacteria bacterium CG_4_10_14_0_2_um_filter_43_8]|nr:MAG: hypothetical protein COV43_04200 [Deltaproteobacteria bacterium CG11_big_fil_rev_8_21_14_0_20_42_23]PJA19252.1 MAG: hypothetical protein COX62_07055 [Deltaproteobacteria bacterium CG_4_10_14_0_2_um_filter_43_8]PJC64127.1 MAG: hypothetical protein CO021_05905 [Deltaproteobacteria bacterium CG_4_9_14_0_2_um_filter_42_21]
MSAPACLIVTSVCLTPALSVMRDLYTMRDAALRLGVTPALVVMDSESVLPAPPSSFGMPTFIGHQITPALRRFCSDHAVQCAFPFEENAVLTAATLHDTFRFPRGLSVSEARLFRNKHFMRKAASDAGVKVPKGNAVRSKNEFIELTQRLGGHVVVKPTSFYGCVGVFEVFPNDDVNEAFEKAKRVNDQSGMVCLVEKYVHGEQCHADVLLQGGCIVFEALGRYTKPPLQFNSFPPQGTVTRNKNRTRSEKKILQKMGKIVHAFGMRDGWAHGEFFVKPNGKVVFGEIAARVGGGMLPALYQKAYGLNVYEAMVLAALDSNYRPRIEAEGPELGAEFLMDFERPESGILTDHTSVEELRQIPGVVDAQMYMNKGDLVTPLVVSTQMLGYFIFQPEGNGSTPTSAQLAVRKQFKASFS